MAISLDRKALAGLASLALLSACGSSDSTASGDNGGPVVLESAEMAVIGSAEEIERFIALQADQRPELEFLDPQPWEEGKQRVEVRLPEGFTNRDMQEVTVEIVDQGLSYNVSWSPQ